MSIDSDHAGFLAECAIFGVKTGGHGGGNIVVGMYVPTFSLVSGISSVAVSPAPAGSYFASTSDPGGIVKWSIVFQATSDNSGNLMSAIVTLPSTLNANFAGGEVVVPDGFTILPAANLGGVGSVGAGCFNTIAGSVGNNLAISWESAVKNVLYQISIAGTFQIQPGGLLKK